MYKMVKLNTNNLFIACNQLQETDFRIDFRLRA